MSRKKEVFEAALEGKKIPYLTLDNKWHKLFTQLNKSTPEVEKYSAELNELLKRQGKLNTEMKEIRKLKKKLMNDVMPLAQKMGVDPDRTTVRKMDEMTRLIEECNEKIDAYRDELADLPKNMDVINQKLMLITMDICYERLQTNTQQIEVIAEWINDMRTQLKENVVHKQEMEIENRKLYDYMHAIFGPDVINLFDMKFVPEPKKKSVKIETRDGDKPEGAQKKPEAKPEGESEASPDDDDRQIKIW